MDRPSSTPHTVAFGKHNHAGKRILVTGGSGFLGSHLCQRLIADGNTVSCLDNYATGSVANKADLIGHPNFALIKHDIVLPLPSEGRYDEIYNLA